MDERESTERSEAWRDIINGLNGFRSEKDKFQLVPTKLYNRQRRNCPEIHKIKVIEQNLRRKGLSTNYHIEEIKGGAKFQTGDNTKHPIFKLRFGDWRILFSFLKDDPESAAKVELFYLHSVFPRKEGYTKILKTIDKRKNVKIEFEPIVNTEIKSSIVKNESWKTNKIDPFIPTDEREYEDLKLLLKDTEMAVLPTIDQIEAISRPTRPLFINGQAGTGKTTGMAWILTLLVPNQLKKVDGRTRILVTAMTQNVVDKLDANTTLLSEHRSKFLESQFKLKENQLTEYYAEVKDLKKETKKNPKKALTASGSDLVFLNFNNIMEIILMSSEGKIKSEHDSLRAQIENPAHCTVDFNPLDATSVRNREHTCSYCDAESGDPNFHHAINAMDRLSHEWKALTSQLTRLSSLRTIIAKMDAQEVDVTRVNYSKFLIEFFGKRKFDLKPEFAWYGIRTLIKGFAVKNGHKPLNKNAFLDLVPDSLKSDFIGKVEQLYLCYDSYRAWLKDNGLRDDIDLAIDTSYVLQNYSALIESKFQHIFLDEAQDLTHAEYQVLLELLDDDCKRNIVLAGDPLQTINPTGFDWNRIKDLMYLEANVESQDPQVLSHNFRTPTKIVNISNGILKLRENFLTNERVSVQVSHEEGPKPVLIYLSGTSNQDIDSSLVDDFFTSKSNYNVLSRRSDDEGVEELLKNDPFSTENIELNHNIMTVTEIKGGEHENIVLYRAGEMESSLLNDILKSKKDLSGISHETKMGLKFIVNQLYILTTRSTKRMYIIEQDPHKGRIWETLFSEDLEIAEDPRARLNDLLMIASEDFDLETYADNQLRLYDETHNRKFLKWIKDAFESAKQPEIKPSARELLYKATALDSEIDGRFEQAGDHWMKANLLRRAFENYVKAKKWAKVRLTGYKDIVNFQQTLTFLEKGKVNSITDITLLRGEVKNQQNQSLSWLNEDDEMRLKQYLFDVIILRDVEKNTLHIPQLLADLGINNFAPNLDKVNGLLSTFVTKEKATQLKNLIDQIKKSKLNVEGMLKYKFELLQLELKGYVTQPEKESEKLAELIKFIDTSKIGTKSKSMYFQHFFVNILEETASIVFESTNPLDLDGFKEKFKTSSQRRGISGDSYKNLIKIISESGSNMSMLMFYLGMVPSYPNSPSGERLPILGTLKDLSINKVKPQSKKVAHFGKNTIRMFQSKQFSDAVMKKCQEQLMKASADDLSFDHITISDYQIMEWTPDIWANSFGEKISKIMINDLNREIFTTWIEWLETRVKHRKSDPKIADIVRKMLKEPAMIEFLDNIAQKTKDRDLTELIKHHNILLKPNSSDSDYKKAAIFFESIGDRKSHLEVLQYLPDAIFSKLANSDALDVKEFADLISETAKNEHSKEVYEKMTQKILSYQKGFMLHQKGLWNGNIISEILAIIHPPSKKKDPLFIYWSMRAKDSMHTMFEHYIPIANKFSFLHWKAVFRDTKDVAEKLQSFDKVGAVFTQLVTTWIQYEEDGEVDLILRQAAVYSIISELCPGGKLVPKSQINAIAKKLDLEVPDRKNSEMVRLLIESYGKKLGFDISDDSIFKTFIEEIQ